MKVVAEQGCTVEVDVFGGTKTCVLARVHFVVRSRTDEVMADVLVDPDHAETMELAIRAARLGATLRNQRGDQ